MTNNKKNINELVISDDDPTVELETLVLQQSFVADDSRSAADGANDDAMSGHVSDPNTRSASIHRLQFDMEQFRAKWLGLATEIQTREQISEKLNNELIELQKELSRKIELLEKRDQKIGTLESKLRQHDDAQILAEHAGRLASDEKQIQELHERFVQAEKYADQLRQQLQDREIAIAAAEDAREFLQQSLDRANKQITKLTTAVVTAETECATLGEKLASLHETHADEIRMIRLELGAAQDTMSQNDLITEQLASDLDENRVYRVELERMLNKSAQSSQSRIEQLEKENRNLRLESGELNDKLGANSESINCLLAELAKKSRQIDSIEAIEDVIHEIDDRISEQIDEYVPPDRERTTRLLIGSVKGKVLRFPLFKNRLTIGRSRHNDIQLKGSCISRRHAVVVIEGDLTRVIDWGSKNGVSVNSKPIKEHFLKNGDIVTVGTAEFRYEERKKRDR